MIKSAALLAPVLVTLFWAIAFFTQSNPSERKVKIYLGIFMLDCFFIYLSHTFFFSRLYNVYSFIESIYLSSMLSAYPLFYLYLQIVATEKPGFKQRFKHFIPAILIGSISLITTLFMSKSERIFYVQDTLLNKNLKGLDLNSIIGLKGYIFFAARFIFLPQVIYYFYKVFVLINRHNKRIDNYYSETEGRTLHWVKVLYVVIILVSLASISFTLIGRSYFARNELSLILPSLIFTSVLYVIGLKGNQQVHIKEELITEKIIQESESYQENQTEHLKIQLLQLFEEKQIYKHPDLKITYVSEVLNTNRTYVSRLINDEFKMNFNEFVNNYRVKAAKDLLCGEKNNSFTMEYIAEKSGFGSVNSFTRVFKEAEGKTPGKFRNDCISKKYSQTQEKTSE